LKLVLSALKDNRLGNEALIAECSKKGLKRLHQTSGAAIRALHKERQQLERGIKRCLDFIVGGDGDPGSVREQLCKLMCRKRELSAELEASKAAEIAIHPDLPDLYRRKVAELQQVLTDETTRPEAVAIVRSLIDHIEVHPGRKRGHCELAIVGALAQILAFAQKRRTAGPSRDGGRWLRG
jgi:site-specific DNA recombinase